MVLASKIFSFSYTKIYCISLGFELSLRQNKHRLKSLFALENCAFSDAFIETND